MKKELCDIRTFLPLLEYDQKCRKVIVLRPFAFDPLLLSAVDIEKSNFMISEVMGILDETTFITGIVLIIDLEGFNLNHLIHRPLGIIKKYMRFNQVCYGRQMANRVVVFSLLCFLLRTLCPVTRKVSTSSECRALSPLRTA